MLLEEKVAEGNRPKAADSFAELRVRVELRRQGTNFRGKLGVHRFTLLLTLLEFGPKSAYGICGAIGFIKGDVEGHDLGAVVVENVQHGREMGARKGPLAESLLRLLVYRDDDDAGIGRSGAGGPITKARVQRVELETLEEGKQGGGSLAKKRKVI